MPEANRESIGFVKPSYDGQSIANIPETAAYLLGASYSHQLSDPRLSHFKENTENVVLLLLDGLGQEQLDFARTRFGVPSFEEIFSPAIRSQITSVFPSTTSTAMTSLHSGLSPQQHGVIGYTMFLRELGTIAQMLRFTPVTGGRSLFDLGIDENQFLGPRTIHMRLGESGITSYVHVPKYIIDSGLSRITYKGARIVPQNSFADMIVGLRKTLESSRHDSFHFAYHASPDTIAHARGTYTEEYAAELESLMRTVRLQLFQKLDRDIARKTVVILSGDHGAVRVPDDAIIDLVNHEGLLDLLELPPTGDSRALILYTRDGKESEVRSYFETKFPGAFEIVESSKLLDEGYFGIGEIHREVRNRIGDLIAIPNFYNAIDNSRLDPRHEPVPGRHGGLSKEEMIVPCITSRLG